LRDIAGKKEATGVAGAIRTASGRGARQNYSAHPAIRRLIRQILKQSKSIRVVAEANSGEEALAHVRKLRPDVMTLDLMMNDMNGIEVLGNLKEFPNRPKVIVISLYNAPHLVSRAMAEGASAFISKSELSPEKLIRTVKSLAEVEGS